MMRTGFAGQSAPSATMGSANMGSARATSSAANKRLMATDPACRRILCEPHAACHLAARDQSPSPKIQSFQLSMPPVHYVSRQQPKGGDPVSHCQFAAVAGNRELDL